jgi:hypothetical protein
MIVYQVVVPLNVVPLVPPSPPLTVNILKFRVNFVQNPHKGMENHVLVVTMLY